MVNATHAISESIPLVQVSMVEVYNESVYDLLVSPDEGHEKLQLQKKGNDVIVPVSIVIVCVYQEILQNN